MIRFWFTPPLCSIVYYVHCARVSSKTCCLAERRIFSVSFIRRRYKSARQMWACFCWWVEEKPGGLPHGGWQLSYCPHLPLFVCHEGCLKWVEFVLKSKPILHIVSFKVISRCVESVSLKSTRRDLESFWPGMARHRVRSLLTAWPRTRGGRCKEEEKGMGTSIHLARIRHMLILSSYS